MKTPDGYKISIEYVDRAEGNVSRVMIRHPQTNAIIYGYRCKSNETPNEAARKWESGEYAYHK